MQSRAESLLEQVCNVGSGFLLSLLIQQFIITPVFDTGTSPTQNLGITVVFTIASLLRGYGWRRAFNWWAARKRRAPAP